MRCLIFGTTDLAENLAFLLEQEGRMIDGFVVDTAYYKESTKKLDFGFAKKEYPIYQFNQLHRLFYPENTEVYVCIGYTEMNSARERVIKTFKSHGFRLPNFKAKTALVEASTIGEGNLFFEGAYVGMYSVVGDGNIFYPNSILAHHSTIGDYNFFAISASVAAHIKIGNRNFFGNNSLTKEKITIGDSNLVGAGAYVSKSLENGMVLVPAQSNVLAGRMSRDFFG